MTDEKFEGELKDLVEMLKSFRRIKDKGRKKWLRFEIREQLRKLIND